MERVKSSFLTILKGLAVPFIALSVVALIAGLFFSLTLLVISVEEGTSNLSDASMSITWASLMLAQGIGFEADSLAISVIPLGYTILLVLMLAMVSRRLQSSMSSKSIGLFVWVVFNGIISQNIAIPLLDTLPIVMVKSAVVYVLALILAGYRKSVWLEKLRMWLSQHLPTMVCRCVRIGIRYTKILLGCYTTVALITVIAWIITGWPRMQQAFRVLGMQTGSSIFTTIIMLAWLPTMVIWAFSWIIGAGFHIGSVASYAIVAVHGEKLPSVPVFSLFPQPITDTLYASLVQWIIPFICVMVALVMLLHPSSLHLRATHEHTHIVWKKTVIDFASALATVVGVSALITLIMPLVFMISNGSLGRYRLANVGVDVIASSRAVGHATLLSCLIAWAVIVIYWLCAWGCALIWRHCQQTQTYQQLMNKIPMLMRKKDVQGDPEQDQSERTIRSNDSNDSRDSYRASSSMRRKTRVARSTSNTHNVDSLPHPDRDARIVRSVKSDNKTSSTKTHAMRTVSSSSKKQ